MEQNNKNLHFIYKLIFKYWRYGISSKPRCSKMFTPAPSSVSWVGLSPAGWEEAQWGFSPLKRGLFSWAEHQNHPPQSFHPNVRSSNSPATPDTVTSPWSHQVGVSTHRGWGLRGWRTASPPKPFACSTLSRETLYSLKSQTCLRMFMHIHSYVLWVGVSLNRFYISRNMVIVQKWRQLGPIYLIFFFLDGDQPISV